MSRTGLYPQRIVRMILKFATLPITGGLVLLFLCIWLVRISLEFARNWLCEEEYAKSMRKEFKEVREYVTGFCTWLVA